MPSRRSKKWGKEKSWWNSHLMRRARSAPYRSVMFHGGKAAETIEVRTEAHVKSWSGKLNKDIE